MLMAGMTAASVIAALMTAFTMLMIMMTALDICIIIQLTFQKCFNRLISIAAASAKQFDTCLSQGILSSASDTAADQHLNLMFCQKSCQSTMSAAVCSYNF